MSGLSFPMVRPDDPPAGSVLHSAIDALTGATVLSLSVPGVAGAVELGRIPLRLALQLPPGRELDIEIAWGEVYDAHPELWEQSLG